MHHPVHLPDRWSFPNRLGRTWLGPERGDPSSRGREDRALGDAEPALRRREVPLLGHQDRAEDRPGREGFVVNGPFDL